MNNKQNLYYALGQVAYSVAAADGTIQKAEKEKLHDIITEGVKDHQVDFDYSEIIFLLMEKNHIDVKTAYEWGLSQFKLNSQYLSEKMKWDFVTVLEKVAEAFPPTTENEKKWIDKFKNDISKIKGDPVFTNEN